MGDSHGITDDHVKSALTSDKGSGAQLTSWVVEDFTKKGDNYVCTVTSIKVDYKMETNDYKTTYVVKIANSHSPSGFGECVDHATSTEVLFYETILSKINRELSAVGQPKLRVPRCVYISVENGRTMIFMKDLRELGFKMFPRHEGLTRTHTCLVLQELARLHAASLLLQRRTTLQQLLINHPILQKKWFNPTDQGESFCTDYFNGFTDNAIASMKQIGGYSQAIAWLEDLKPNILTIAKKCTDPNPPTPFIAFCHGDCWTNNFLFRYSEDGSTPVEVMLVDLQTIRLASVGSDLNFLLFTSLTSSDRCQYEDNFLDTYHQALIQVTGAGDLPVPFTREQLLQEYRDKNTYGIIFAIYIILLIIPDGEDAQDLQGMSDDKLQEFMEKQQKTLLAKLINSPILESRLLSSFKEVIGLE